MSTPGAIVIQHNIDDEGGSSYTAVELPELAAISPEILGYMDPKIMSVSLLIEVNFENGGAYYEYHSYPDGRIDPEQERTFGSLVLKRTERWDKEPS